MNNLQVFNHAEFGSVRTATINGVPFFVGKDVAEVLGYSNSKDALAKHVDEEDKKILKGSDLRPLENHIPKEAFPVNFRYADIPNRGWTIINESGLYSLIISSKLPKAKQFKHWVTSEVLPAIRKYGVYAMDAMLENPDVLINALQAYKAERQQRIKLQAENAKQRVKITTQQEKISTQQEKISTQQQLITDMEPKASYYDMVLSSPDLVSITVIAKDYGWSGIRMNEYLRSKKIQYKKGYTWMLYADYADKGYTGTKTMAFSSSDGDNHAKVHTYWTQKGRLFIYDTLKNDGILPLMEEMNNGSIIDAEVE